MYKLYYLSWSNYAQFIKNIINYNISDSISRKNNKTVKYQKNNVMFNTTFMT